MFESTYYADTRENSKNSFYPNHLPIHSEEDFKTLCSHDYVCAEYQNNHRGSKYFIRSDCLTMDCDNDHTDKETDWVTPQDVINAFPNVSMAFHMSRHNNLPKDNYSARPRFHVFFEIDEITDQQEYRKLKETLLEKFPWFDPGAKDAGRFFYGTKHPDILFVPGSLTLTAFLKDGKEPVLPKGKKVPKLEETTKSNSSFQSGSFPKHINSLEDFAASLSPGEAEEIQEGSRHNKLIKKAGVVLKLHGDTQEARTQFQRYVDACTPPLPEEEVSKIWNDTIHWYHSVVEKDPNYQPPEQYKKEQEEKQETSSFQLLPKHYTDVDEAQVIARQLSENTRYVATGFTVYKKGYWHTNSDYELEAQLRVTKILNRQLTEAEQKLKEENANLKKSGVEEADLPKISHALNQKEIAAFLDKYRNARIQKIFFTCCEAITYYQKVLDKWMSNNGINAIMNRLKPNLHMDIHDMDRDPYLLNTPSYTFDLRKGTKGKLIQSKEDYITHQTTCDPGTKGGTLWRKFLNQIFLNDQDLIHYVQQICGLAAIGEVRMESLIIAYGDGKNGKSTFWNTIGHVLGSYLGYVSAEAFTTRPGRNVRPEMAQLRGKRLVIAAELGGGTRLDSAKVKQMCSSDDILAEPKYHDPFYFKPSHTIVMYTNNLPRVSELDAGTWRRLGVIIPFKATISEQDDIKDYASYLYDNAKEAILSWIIEGARQVIEANFKLPVPEAITQETSRYREENNWVQHFVEMACELKIDNPQDEEKRYCVRALSLQETYAKYCRTVGEFQHSPSEVSQALLQLEGVTKRRTSKGVYYFGIRCLNEFDKFDR